jgi:glucokinase
MHEPSANYHNPTSDGVRVMAHWIGIDLGGTKILAGLFDDSLKLLARAKIPTEAHLGPENILARIGQTVDGILGEAKVSAADVKGLGIGIPGQIEPGGSVVRFAPNLDWRNLDVKPILPAAWTWPVVLENDVRMGTFGEYAQGAARGAKHVFGIFVGTGVGGGLIIDGRLHTGFNGHGGEIGHVVMHWRRGETLESIAGRKYQMIRAKELLDDAPKRVRKEWKGVDLEKVKSSQLAEFYQRDDPIAVQLIDDAARALGAAIAGVVNFISPQIVVVGGGVTGALGDPFIERIWELAQRHILPDAARNVKCLAAALGDDSGIVGSAAYAKLKLAGP